MNTGAVGRYLSYSSSLSSIKTGGYSDAETLVELEEVDALASGLRLRGRESPGDESDDTLEGDEEWKERAWKGEGIDVLWFKDLDHAQVFDKAPSRKRLISCILSYCDDE